MAAPVKSDGGSTSYYQLPEGAEELQDLIEHKDMNFSIGNIFKACYRLGEKQGADRQYDLKKIIFFAQRELERAGKEPTHVLTVNLDRVRLNYPRIEEDIREAFNPSKR